MGVGERIRRYGEAALLIAVVAAAALLGNRMEAAGSQAEKITKIKRVAPVQKKLTLELKKKKTFKVRICPGKLTKKARGLRVKTDKKALLKLGSVKYSKKKGKCFAIFTVKAVKAGTVKLTLSPKNKKIKKSLSWTIRIPEGDTVENEETIPVQEGQKEPETEPAQSEQKEPETEPAQSEQKEPETESEQSEQEEPGDKPITGEQSAEEFFREQNYRAQELLAAWIDRDSNAMVSGYSLRTALSMLASGASGQTRVELEGYFGATVQDLERFGAEASAMYDREGLYSGNMAWVDQSMTLAGDYRKKLEQAYNAGIVTLDFADTVKSADAINDWCSQCTKQMIPKLVTPDSLEYQKLVLANVLYFEQKWADPFVKEYTKKKDFYTGSGQKKKADMMSGSGDSYIETAESEGFVKDYENGYYFAAIRAKKIGSAVSASDIRRLGDLAKNAGKDFEVRIELPRVKFDGDYQLGDYLKKSGIRRAFSGEAELDGMVSAGGPLQVSDVIQKTAVEIDEEGTKAAAATAVIVKNTAMMDPREVKTVVLDQPFAFGIFDGATGEMLFSGYVNTP